MVLPQHLSDLCYQFDTCRRENGWFFACRILGTEVVSRAAVKLGIARMKKYQWYHFPDDELDVSTTTVVPVDELTIDEAVRAHAVWYEATAPFEFRYALSRLGVDFAEYDFIDYGSGKGRVLLMAAEYPFKRIFGVEVDRGLHDTAEENLKRVKRARFKCRDIRLVLSNATEWQPPPGPSIVFMYNPFDEVVLGPVLDRVVQAVAQADRSTYLLFHRSSPRHREAIAARSFVRVRSHFDDGWMIYRYGRCPTER